MYSTKDILLRISGIIILIAAILYLFTPVVAPWMMAVGVVLFSVVTLTNPYPGKSIRGKRLFNFRLFACVLMIVSTYLMFRQRSEWPLVMICGAIFLLYAAIVIPRELKKETERE